MAAAAPAGGGSPQNLWSFLCPTPEQKQACRDKICNSPAGQLLNNILKPLSLFTGGVVGGLCPANQPSAQDLAQPSDSAEGAAARIKQDEADAQKRRDSVRYLGTVDCRYWPEAQKALINALRGDRNECVRLEAALALGRGCCCTKPVLEALVRTVGGDDRDGFPAERSPRVLAAAQQAMHHCLSCYAEVTVGPATPGERPEKPTPPEKPGEPPPLRPIAEASTGPTGQRPDDVGPFLLEGARRLDDTPAPAPPRINDGVISLILQACKAPVVPPSTPPPPAADAPPGQ
jgi:hypothetical protein